MPKTVSIPPAAGTNASDTSKCCNAANDVDDGAASEIMERWVELVEPTTPPRPPYSERERHTRNENRERDVRMQRRPLSHCGARGMKVTHRSIKSDVGYGDPSARRVFCVAVVAVCWCV